MGYRIDLSKTPKQILVERINYVFKLSYSENNYEFNPRGVWPLTRAERRAKGVESKVAARFVNGVHGTQEFYLTRADLNKLLKDVTVEVPKGATEWSHELVPYIVDELGLQLDTYDIMVEPITPETESYEARLIPHHLSFKGTIAITFVDPTPRKLAQLVTKRALDGFRPGEFLNG
ncbi:TPA: hypothetical protein ACNABY_000711 [Escherichia coli]